MEKSNKRFIKSLGVISLVLLVVSSLLFATLLKNWMNYFFPFVIVYFFLFSSVQHLKLTKAAQGKTRDFHTNYMAWFGIRLFLNLSFVIVYVLLNRTQALSFVLFFAFCYVVYTAYEVSSLSKILRSDNVK
ncbi:hypothetical protein [Labilibaculum sp.]|uniref:hypothetical protein n=1 Tax=Labilibaculum sp. TaxID=2060723 RepID=UPI003567F956